MKRVLKTLGAAVLVVLALAAAYVFLLLGEPEDETKNTAQVDEAKITMPMSPLESPGETNVAGLADTFGQPVLAIQQGLSMRKARIYDTAFEGGYARRVTLTYATEDGAVITAESIRPTSAVTLLKTSGATLDATALYTLGGLNAGRMDDGQQICVFGQTGEAVYAILCPKTHESEIEDILRQTALIAQD